MWVSNALNIKLPDGCFDGGWKWDPAKFTKFDHVFFEVGRIEDHIMHRWVYILASPDVAKNYFFHATLKGKADRKISVFCQARSLNESWKEIIANREDTFQADVETLKKFRQENFGFDYQIEVRNMKEEAKDENEESGISDNDD